MKGAFRHDTILLRWYVDNVLSTPRSKLNLRDVCTRRHDGNVGVPQKQTSPKGTASVKGREVETVSRITCFINFKPRFDIIVRVVSIAQIVAKYEPRLSRRLYGNHALQTRKGRGFEADFFFILSIALSLETVTRTFVSFRFKFYSH